MVQEIIIPFKWSGWDTQDVLLNSYYEVEFTEDFGAFNKGDIFSSISVDYGKGVVEAYSEDGTEVVKKQMFIAKPI